MSNQAIKVGLRVVRGPDWQWRDQDGGEGHVGTVVEIGSEGNPRNPPKTVFVQWDAGGRTNYRCGYQGKHDLRVLDNATLGLQHLHVQCDICGKNSFSGFRWKCKNCSNYDLCNSCYRTDKHSVEHQFWRITSPSASRVDVPCRKGAVCLVARGVYQGARVSRGPNWEWDDQDGGPGSVGEVLDIRGWNQESTDSVVKVKWENGTSNVYRVGHQGKVDLKCLEATASKPYYRDHLPVLTLDQSQPAPAPSPTPAPAAGASSDDSEGLAVGNLVRVSLEIEVWQVLQQSQCTWDDEMIQAIGAIGEVTLIKPDGCPRVKFKRAGMEFAVHPAALTKIPNLSKGDFVQMIDDVEEVKSLLIDHGGWVPDMMPYMKEVGRVVFAMPDHKVRVRYGSHIWTFHPGCLKKIADGNSDDEDAQDSSVDGEDLSKLMEQLHSLGLADPSILIAGAVKAGDASIVRQILSEHPEAVNGTVGDQKYSHILAAAHFGKTELIEILHAAGAKISHEDSEGDSAMHYAVIGDEPASIHCLARLGADVNVCNHKAATAMHIAVNRGSVPCVKALLEHGASLTMQDAAGDTPLHDAIARDHDDVVGVLLESGADVTVKNYRGFPAFHQAALKGTAYVMEKLVEHHPHLVNSTKDDGFSSLHLAAFNNHVGVATVLLQQESCTVDPLTGDGKTPLMLATWRTYSSSIELFISYGANLDLQDPKGNTVLHLALIRASGAALSIVDLPSSSESSSPIVDGIKENLPLRDESQKTTTAIACFLAQEGCSLTQRNHDGKTPLDLCSSSEIRGLVERHAKPKGWSGFHGSNCRAQGAAASGHRLGGEEALPEGLTTVESTDALEDCLLCEAKANMRCQPCGHQVLCVSCGRRGKRCGVRSCKVEVKERQMVVMHREECFLCSEPAVVEFKPCGHAVTCKGCSAAAKKCPKCQTAVTERLFNGKPMGSSSASTPAGGGGGGGGEEDLDDSLVCVICLETRKEVAFLCGHQTCSVCSKRVFNCPVCRKPITHRIQLF